MTTETLITFLLEDLLPVINIIIALDATYRNIVDISSIKNRRFKIIIALTAFGTLLLAVLYTIILLGADHVIQPDYSKFSSTYIRPLLTYIIVLLNITARNRKAERKAEKKAELNQGGVGK